MNINWRRILFWVFVVVLVFWLVNNPTQAGNDVTLAWHKLQQGGDAIITFVNSILGGALR